MIGHCLSLRYNDCMLFDANSIVAKRLVLGIDLMTTAESPHNYPPNTRAAFEALSKITFTHGTPLFTEILQRLFDEKTHERMAYNLALVAHWLPVIVCDRNLQAIDDFVLDIVIRDPNKRYELYWFECFTEHLWDIEINVEPQQ